MNIVKGVADLLRRSTGTHAGEGSQWGQGGRFSAPSTRICFGNVGQEAVLKSLWQRYENAIDKMEKRKLLQVFLMQFIQAYKNWEPDRDTLSDSMPTHPLSEHASGFQGVVIGCTAGHPSEVILILIQELTRITALITDMNSSYTESSADLSFSVEGLYILNSFDIITRSIHNCRVFSYYGGVQKVIALLKAAVVQLKALTSVLVVDECLSNISTEKARTLHKILVYVVSIIFNFTDLNLSGHGKTLYSDNIPHYFSTNWEEVPNSSIKASMSEASAHWQQKATVLVMEAGGLNWLVELLRVIRRLNLKEQWTEPSLHYLTFGTLRSALFHNPRAQNHFRCIGGLEVLLDGLGFPSSNYLIYKVEFLSDNGRSENYLFGMFQLQILSMEVLRESIFGNMNNLQFLCENGRVHKFANNICWPAFMFQEFRQQKFGSSSCHFYPPDPTEDCRRIGLKEPSSQGQSDSSFCSDWKLYAVKLSRALYSFLLPPEDTKLSDARISVTQISLPVSLAYCELSAKWILKVLSTVFPCMKACSTENELPDHLMVLACTLQHHTLHAFKKLLVSAPTLLDVFREGGIWDFIFSEKFFYFGPTLEEGFMEIGPCSDDKPGNCSTSEHAVNQLKPANIDTLHMEVISFVEFASTLETNKHNLPECSALIDALEQSAWIPRLSTILLKTVHRIMQRAFEQTVASFRALDGGARILRVACIQAQECRKLGSLSSVGHDFGNQSIQSKYDYRTEPLEVTKAWISCMESSMDLFTEYLLTAEDGKSLIMHNATCVDCLFDLFWEEGLRSRVLDHILSLMKLPQSSLTDQTAKLQLCSKYLETFTRAKEREKCFAELSIDLLAGMKDVLLTDQSYYQTLFREGECFLHIVSLLNGSLDEETGEQLVLNVLETLTLLLSGNALSKAAFRALVGAGYQTLQSLLLDFFQCRPSVRLLNALLDMLVDGKFDDKENSMIKNEDVILLFLNVLQKSSDSLQHYGLDILQNLLRDSISNRTSCFKAGVLSYLLDWFPQKVDGVMITKIAQLIQVIGGYSVTGKDIRKIFTLLRSERIRSRQNHCSLLLNSIGAMLREKGPTAFFQFNGFDSGIVIKTPVQWPYTKGFSFTSWVRVENFPAGAMGLFCFLTDNGRGCLAMLGKDKLVFESINQKKQCVSSPLPVFSKRWHFLCITHSIGRPFSGGSTLRCYVDGNLVSSEKCRYPRVSDTLTCCSIGTRPMAHYEESSQLAVEETFPFLGQMGPSYLFGDTLSSDQLKGIYSLGPSYMYSFAANEFPLIFGNLFPNGVPDAKDGISTKIIFGLNAQASNGRFLFNVSSSTDRTSEKNLFQAIVMDGTQLCSRRLLQDIIYCVGGVSVFFPLLAQMDTSETDNGVYDHMVVKSDARDKLAADVIELITSVLDDNLANQQQMRLLSGFSILGILFQTVSLQQLNMDTFVSLKRLLHVLRNSGVPELVKDAISCIYLNPNIWVFAEFKVQRELYMLLIHHFENDPSLLTALCGLPHIFDMIHNFYCDKPDRHSIGRKPLLRFKTRQVAIERPAQEEIHKIRLLLLSLAEMGLRQRISVTDIKALVAFLEKNQDMLCIEDVLHMAIRALSQKPLLSSFLEQVDVVGGCHVFINLLQREVEPIRLLALQFLGALLVGLPSEKKGSRFFSLSVGRPKSLSDSNRKEGNTRVRPILSAIWDRLSMFPLSDHLYATLFDVLLGGASPKQVLQKHNRVQQNWTKTNHSGSSSHFLLPQILVLIFKFLESCKDNTAREKILRDLLDLLDSNPSNIEALMENGWTSWLETSVKLYAFGNCGTVPEVSNDDFHKNEKMLVRNLFCIVLSHYIFSIRGGWHQLEETVNFLLLCSEQKLGSHKLLRHIFEDLIDSLVEVASEENILLSQPCRDNTLYLLKLLDEMLICESGDKLPFPAGGLYTLFPSDFQASEGQKDISVAIGEILNSEGIHQLPRITWSNTSFLPADGSMGSDWWKLYDSIWVLISEMNGKGSNKFLDKAPTLGGPSFGQRARGLVESLNIPAAEVAAVVSGGIGSALGGKSGKHVDKAMLLRGEKYPRIVFRLVVLYICGAPLERASRCVQQFNDLLPSLVSSDDEQNKNRVQLFIWSLLTGRSHYGMLDNAARFHIVTQLILEMVNCAKTVLATSILSRDDSSSFDAGNNEKESVPILNLIQKDRILVAVADEMRYIKASKCDRLRQLDALRIKIDELCLGELNQKKGLEDEFEMNMSAILSSDDSRRASYQLAHDEDQEIAVERWVHMLRALIDERGPWSANPFPNEAIKHWKLDKTEDSLRRRPKLRRNYHFDERLCHPPATNQLQTNNPVMESHTTLGSLPVQMKHFLRKGACGIPEEGRSDTEDANSSGGVASSMNDSLETEGPGIPREHKDLLDVQDNDDVPTSHGDAETNQVVLSIPCVLITPKRKLAGHLAVMRDALHFSSKFLVEGSGGSSIFRHFHVLSNSDPSKHDQLGGSHKQRHHKELGNVGMDCVKGNLVDITDPRCKNIKQHRRWNISKVKAVHWTRYLLQYTAIEIFFNDSTAPIFLNFASSNDAKYVGTSIVSSRNESLFPKGSSRDKGGVIFFVDRRVAVELAETARESWRRREISNFEYLMILNTLAGRSYNDLTQYPIFPWVLADYSSEKLDFNKSSTFRDLSKPVGALDLKRFQVFEDRYHNFCDPDIPSFYYGSHYSSMGIVLFYLLRLEPFTALHRALQGGKFDHADRLFQSIESTYRNCLSNTSDVKELIPEFFYFPEFVINSNSYHLGVKQDGEPLNDVSLPPWAKGSPEEFIYRNREALESEFVSSNLHQWIDLIFGYKQRGKPAIEAANVFYYLTYEGAVDLETMDDELQRSAIEDQIANFGQTPIQLFRKKHPRRGPPIPIVHPLYFAPASITLTSIMSNATQSSSPVLYLDLLNSNIIVVNKELTLSVKMWLTTQLQSGGNFTFSSAQDPFFGIGSDTLPPRKIGTPVAENFENGRQCFATIQTPTENYLISCGNWENSFQVTSINDGKTIQSVRQHKDLVSCVSVTSDGSILATGSYDTTVMLWEILRGGSREKRVSNAQTELSWKDHVIDESPFHILCGHDDIITCLFVSIDLNIVISGSKDGTCIFHTLREGRYVRSIWHPSGSALSKLVASQNGRVVIYAENDLSLHMYSINGKHIASSESNGRLNCIELSNCGDFLVCAGDHGQILLRSMYSLEVVRKYEGIGKIITSLVVTPEECFLAGTKDGSLLVYSIENPQLRRGSLPRNIKPKVSATG